MHHHHQDAHRAGLATPELARVDPAGLAPLGTAGAAPVHVAPNSEALAGDTAQRSKGHTQDDGQIIGAVLPGGNADDKAEVSMRARAALAGCGLYQLADGCFLLTKWGLAKTCPDLRSVGALLARLGAVA